jgi:dihydrofolate reductase
MTERKLYIYIAMSLDGFIATKDDDLTFLNVADKEGEDYGYAEFTANIDTYIVGRKTYDKVLSMVGNFPPSERFKCYVMTRQERKPENGVTFYTGDIEELIQSIRSTSGKNIYCDGGGEIIKLLMEKDLIDEYIVSVIPTLLGDGKRLFMGGTPTISLEAIPPKFFDTGLVQLHYIRKRPQA